MPHPLYQTFHFNRYHHLASKSIRARVLVASRNGIVNVNQNPRIRRAVRSRESHEVLRCRATPSRNIDLRAGEIKLGAALAASRVERNVLVAHQVLARCDARGDLDIVVGGT
jgi:hypothetical protein